MARNDNRGRASRSGNRNNNPSGRNQYSGGVMEMARERPIAAAAAAAGAAAAGLFLWSKRAQISNQLSGLSDQIGEWSEGMRGNSGDFSADDDTAGLTTAASTSSRQRGMSETGSGNASLGRRSGGSRSTGSPTGRGRARSQPTT